MFGVKKVEIFKIRNMKQIIKIITGIFFMPFLLLAFVVAVLRLIYALTIEFTIVQSTEWFEKMLLWVDTNMEKLKE